MLVYPSQEAGVSLFMSFLPIVSHHWIKSLTNNSVSPWCLAVATAPMSWGLSPRADTCQGEGGVTDSQNIPCSSVPFSQNWSLFTSKIQQSSIFAFAFFIKYMKYFISYRHDMLDITWLCICNLIISCDTTKIHVKTMKSASYWTKSQRITR